MSENRAIACTWSHDGDTALASGAWLRRRRLVPLSFVLKRACTARVLGERPEKRVPKTRPPSSRRRPPPAAAGPKEPPSPARCRREPLVRGGVVSRDPPGVLIRENECVAAWMPRLGLTPRPAVFAPVGRPCFRRGSDSSCTNVFVRLASSASFGDGWPMVVEVQRRKPRRSAAEHREPPQRRRRGRRRFRLMAAFRP